MDSIHEQLFSTLIATASMLAVVSTSGMLLGCAVEADSESVAAAEGEDDADAAALGEAEDPLLDVLYDNLLTEFPSDARSERTATPISTGTGISPRASAERLLMVLAMRAGAHVHDYRTPLTTSGAAHSALRISLGRSLFPTRRESRDGND
jgi:hypothetical protein